jgi:osmotically-inducible protein OsmY
VNADNTGRNANDDAQSLTPLDQGMSEQDVAITTSVRKAVMAHKGLSVNAQNVKIIAKDGVVTLRGPVASESERSTIVQMAEQVPEVQTVVNKLEIAAR